MALAEAKLAKAQAKVKLAQAELNFTDVKAPFDGIVDRLHEQQGSLIEEGDILTTLVRQQRDVGLLQRARGPLPRIQGRTGQRATARTICRSNSMLANGEQVSADRARSARSRPTSTTRPATSPSARTSRIPNGLLRHGQTGTVLIHRVLKDAVVIPQRATFEILDKRYVYVVDEDNVVHQREITDPDTSWTTSS